MRRFAITTHTTEVPLNDQRRGRALFTVTNETEASVRGDAVVMRQGDYDPVQLVVDRPSRKYLPRAAEQVAVAIEVPEGMPAGVYGFSLGVVPRDSAQEDQLDEGPVCRFTVLVEEQPAVPALPASLDRARPPVRRNLSDPAEYREHVADTMEQAHELASRNARLGDRYAFVAILLAFASSAVGFLTAATEIAVVGIAAGILAAIGGAVGAWVRRAQYDAVSSANDHLTRALHREIVQYDTRVGAYVAASGETPAQTRGRTFRLFVERCEQLSADAEAALRTAHRND